jgi:hypothetical protein
MGDAAASATSSCTDLGLVVLAPGDRIHDRPLSQVVIYDLRGDDGSERRVWFKTNGVGVVTSRA